MALADYMLCCVCECKTFYDSNLNYDFNDSPNTGLSNTAEILSLCDECAKEKMLKIADKNAPDLALPDGLKAELNFLLLNYECIMKNCYFPDSETQTIVGPDQSYLIRIRAAIERLNGVESCPNN